MEATVGASNKNSEQLVYSSKKEKSVVSRCLAAEQCF